MFVVKVLFWFSLLIFVYVCLGYPLLLALIIKMKKNHLIQNKEEFLPSVTLIIAAHNEETIIAEKLNNSLQLDYPREKLEIIVFSDASSDNTDNIVKEYATFGVRLIRIEGRKGKTYCQNETVKLSNSDILIFSDANSIYNLDSIKKLVQYFKDPAVGCVSGELRYRDRNDGVTGERAYWRYESTIKRLESRVTSPVGANGAIYAVRRDIYEPLRPDVISDFVEPLMIIRKGYQVIHEADAVAWENTAQTIESEFRKRVRIVSRTVHSLIRQPGLLSLLNPFRYKFFAVQIWSHRILRWLSGVFILIASILDLFLLKQGKIYQVCFVCQTSFYCLAFWGLIGEKFFKKKTPRFPHVAYFFCLSCWAMFLGMLRGIRGTAPVVWSPSR